MQNRNIRRMIGLPILDKMFDEQGSLRMYANILVSTDGSDVAKKGVQHGIALAKALNAKVTVITVTEPVPVFFYGFGHSSGWIPAQEDFDAVARNLRAKCSMRPGRWQSRSGYLRNSCIPRMRTQPLRLSKQQSPNAAT